MQKSDLAITIRNLRKQVGLTQAELARRSDVPQQRISRIETLGVGGESDCVKLSNVLPVSAGELQSLLRPDLPHSSHNEWFYDRRTTYFPPTKKSGRERYQSGMAAFPELLRPLWTGLSTSQRSWLEIVSTDSLEEWMAYAHRCAAGMEPSACVPQRLGVRHLPVVDFDTGEGVGDLAFPALVGCVAGIRQAIIPQVTLQAGKTRYPLDFALIVMFQRRRHAIDGEVDGTGHRPTYDRVRSRALAMPELRFHPEESYRANFNELYDGRLHALLGGLPV